MKNKQDTFFCSSDAKSYISYDVPQDSITKRFDFSSYEGSYTHNKVKSSKRLHAIIEEIHDNYVVLNCMVDEKENICQKRKFDIEPFIDKFDLYEGEGVEIVINTYSGKREFLYKKCEDSKILFEETEDLFSKYKGTSFFPNN